MKSIKTRLLKSYFLIIVLTVFICEVFLISSIRKYFYDNTKDFLSNQIKMSAQFYNTYLSSTGLEENIAADVDVFWKNTPAQVQILALSGNILMDSIGYYQTEVIDTKDFKAASSGDLGYVIYENPKSNETLMSVAYPLKKQDKIEGVLRFITSMEKVDKTIKEISNFLILIGLSVILLSSIISIFVSKKITKPIKIITDGAEKMASGNLEEKIKKTTNDELGKLTDTLNYMSEEILKNEKLKNEFIASVSHELRTPLTSIKGWAVALSLCDPENKSEFEDGLKIIEQESDRLTLLVEELLDFSKLISGKITLKKELIDLNNFVDHMIKQLTPRSQRENIKISVTNKCLIPNIYADKNRLKQLFMNILDNSFKFTPNGGEILISTSIQDNYLFITIKDTGCGIPKEDLPKVKEKFYKGKNTKSKNGIGLSICNEIVSLHNGVLNIFSEENDGTEVQIMLPIESIIDSSSNL
ncbi:HAMP domain-containing sensor histidine kinase [Clostridium sp. MB40-C1]|uniref:HAMP domain-containing sensor histidine kinase n=1 Tax=Clostridium sp. MB40-C1 TaxID=3070996 RepID=UPI0027E0EAB0|nr:HAMP domain-containing sensor histidine kinase [Clostridium sp. MB40-C1]WMJ79844.1 HAMP domain-containing sensor histidine kinase [Clostridium sp. MB40-C1]